MRAVSDKIAGLFGVVLCASLAGCHSSMEGKMLYQSFEDLPAALETARVEHKMVLLIFDWHGAPVRNDCFRVLNERNILPMVQEHLVVARVMVDDRDTGGFYAKMQVRLTGQIFQPMYLLLCPDGQPLPGAGYKAYVPKNSPAAVEDFRIFLLDGLRQRCLL